MARTVITLEEEENLYFHINYEYMWKKLNTTPYYVGGSGELPKWIREPWLLPSYANLSKCLSPSFVPSMNIVNKIVQFYNANIRPEIDAYAFLHEKLEAGDHVRMAEAGADTTPYCGTYYCYYYAGIADRKEVYAAVLKLQRSHESTSAQLITGITTDADLKGTGLKGLLELKDIPLEAYIAYRDGLELSKRRTTLYKGSVEAAPGILTLQLHSVDRDGSLVVLRLPLTEGLNGQYLGSLGMLTLISDRSLQILKMGSMRADMKELKPFSVKDERLSRVLAIEKLPNEHILLSFADNALWNDMIISSAE